jgi:hypothetical protein
MIIFQNFQQEIFFICMIYISSLPTMLLEKMSIYTQKFYLFIVTSFYFIITCSFSVFVENCIFILPKGINEFVVFLCEQLTTER